jgi:hypothetical protein
VDGSGLVDVAGGDAVLAVEQLLAALGRPAQQRLLPFGGRATAPGSPNEPPATESLRK